MKCFCAIFAIISLGYCLVIDAAEPATPAEADFLKSPIEQKAAKNGDKPDEELFKKLIRVKKGEMAAPQGEEGSVKVEILKMTVGESRPWSYRQDIGNGKAETLVYPVKATYTVTTYYRKATEISDNWVRILNFYVNSTGEWQIGSEESVKVGKTKRIEK